MPKLIPFILLCITYNISQAQDIIKNYVKQNTHQVLTIEPDSTDYSDLKSIGDAIGDKRIVLLGEQSHGDAVTFLAKSRLVKYLHEKKGFNVLAFESDFVSLTGGWDKLEKNKTAIDSFVKGNIFPIWTLCHTCDNLFYKYILQTQTSASPLQLAGFDCQLHGRYVYKNLKLSLQTTLLNLSYASTVKNDIDTILKYTDSLVLSTFMKNKSYYASVIASLDTILTMDKMNHELSDWSLIVLKNLIAQSNNMRIYTSGPLPNHYYRDKQMAENIEWLVSQKYTNEKIIVWAHNAHIAKNYGYDYKNASEQNFMMGDFLYSKPSVAKEMYILGFTSYKGKTAWTSSKLFGTTVAKPKKNSFERWINNGYDYAFVDFTKYNMQNPDKTEAFSMKASIASVGRQHNNYVHLWTKIFDGIFFIREMYGCK
jgi:erythromycin esterase